MRYVLNNKVDIKSTYPKERKESLSFLATKGRGTNFPSFLTQLNRP